MFRHEPRDRSGPMDVDNPDPMARLAQYALGPDEGPSRKRMHMDIDTPSRAFPSSSSSSSGPMHFGTDTPFIFHSAPRSPSYEPYDPSKWAARNFKFGFSGSGSGVGAEDVEMRFGDSPSRSRDPGTAPSTTDHTDQAGQADQVDKKEDRHKGDDKARDDSRSDVGDGEVRKIASGAVTRVRRKRQKEWRRRRGSDTDGEPDDRQVGPSKSEHHYNLHMPTQALQHSEIPKLLLGYLQVFVNISIVVFCIFLVIQFVLTVRRDVKDRMREHSVELLQEIAECTNLYLTNRCDPAMRVPAMEPACRAWELCMNRDPTVIGRIEVVAETFAGSINSFVDAISWKTMGFTLVTLSFLVILTNSALYNLRSRHPTAPAAPLQNHYPPQPPFLQNGQPYPYPAQSQNPLSLAAHGQSQMHSQAQQGAIGWNGPGTEEEKKKGWW